MMQFNPMLGLFEFGIPKTSADDADQIYAGILRIHSDATYRVRTDKLVRVLATDTPTVQNITGLFVV